MVGYFNKCPDMAAPAIGICDVVEGCGVVLNSTLVERVCRFLERYPTFQPSDGDISPPQSKDASFVETEVITCVCD